MKILFLSFSSLKFDFNTPDTQPLGGTESAICYLGRALKKLGHTVDLRGASGSIYDVVVVANSPGNIPAVRKQYFNAKIILWNHMWNDQPAMAALSSIAVLGAIDHIVYVSQKQKEPYTALQARNPAVDQFPMLLRKFDGTVIPNAIAPSFEKMYRSPDQVLNDKECRGAYTSTPFRGLDHLLNIRELPIDVYSSMAVYQQPDHGYIRLYEQIGHNPSIKMHGSLPQSELAQALRKAAFLVYPCTFEECHSIAILEAQAAGLKVITTKKALETDKYAAVAQDFDEFMELLKSNIALYRMDIALWSYHQLEQVKYVNDNFTWAKRAREWEKLFTGLMQKGA